MYKIFHLFAKKCAYFSLIASFSSEFKVGDFVAVVYDAKWFIGKIEEIDREENDCEVNFLTNAKHMFRWPTTPDLLWVDQTHILCKVKSLVPSGKSARLYKVNSFIPTRK
jgi:hypothetical protein